MSLQHEVFPLDRGESSEPPRLAVVTRAVAWNDPDNFAGRTVARNEVVFVFTGNTYGCVDESTGIALSFTGPQYPASFFQFPQDAIRLL